VSRRSSTQRTSSQLENQMDLSEQIKASTKEIHVRAENTQLMLKYIKTTCQNNLQCFFCVPLRDLQSTGRGDGQKCFTHPGVTLERDLEHFFGQEWQKRVIIPAATHRYTQRLLQGTGDLSGGQVLGKITQKSIGLSSGEGLSFFSFPGVSSPNRFKQLYRSRMNSIELTKEERDGVLEEAIMAFDLNIQVFDDLQKMLRVTEEAYAIISSLSIMQLSLGICVALATVRMGIYVF
uniref:Heme oxygenase 1a n=1 Tax=Oncorhynchus tshawytscha TaxID=74940 RepID=A0AAZ3RBD3_ONCTS